MVLSQDMIRREVLNERTLHLMILNVILRKGNKPDSGIREIDDHQMQKLCESTGFRSGNTKTGM